MRKDHVSKPDAPATRRSGQPAPHPNMTATQAAAAVTRLELALMRCHEAFCQWAVELHKTATGEQMTFAEIALLNCVRFRGGSTTLAEMMVFLHRYDIAAIGYGLRKLEQKGLLARNKGRFRKEVMYSITARGVEVTDRFARERAAVLLGPSDDIRALALVADEVSAALDRLSGLYDRGVQDLARAAAIEPGDPLQR